MPASDLAVVLCWAFLGLGDAEFTWRSTLAEGMAAAARARRPLLVYFPPVREADEPRALAQFEKSAGTPPIAIGVRVGADEILALKERFHVKKVPAAVLIDRRENLLVGWYEGLPAAFPSQVQSAVRKLEKREEEDDRAAAEAKRLASEGNLEGAYRKAAPLLSSPRSNPESLDQARAIERDLRVVLRRDLFRVLAGEGIRPDADVVRDLEALRAKTSHPGFQLEAAVEIRRLKGGALGAR